jgi:Fur family transcriptional regulator, ferric uptake regulator
VAEHDCDRDWLEHTDAVLRGAGLRATAGRSAVVEHLARQRCLVTAQEIVDALRGDEHHSASTATVYRALETLHEFGLVRRFDAGEGVARYEPVDPSGDHHHHVVFEDGSVEAFEDGELEAAFEGLADRLGLDLTGHDVILRARRRSG